MNEPDILNLLKERLKIKIRIEKEYGWTSTHKFTVELRLDEELISEDWDYISIDRD